MWDNLNYYVMDKITLHTDYVDGIPWIETGDDLPLCNQEWGIYPNHVFTSIPCKVVTEDSRITLAVYVSAVSAAIKNDGTRAKWEGWAEKTDDDEDYLCVHDVLNGKALKVLRWHYPKGTQLPTNKSMEKMIFMTKCMDRAADFIDSHPREWPLVQEDGTIIATGPAVIGKSGTEPVR